MLHGAGALALFSLVVLVVLVVLSRFSRNLSIGERRALAYSVLLYIIKQLPKATLRWPKATSPPQELEGGPRSGPNF